MRLRTYTPESVVSGPTDLPEPEEKANARPSFTPYARSDEIDDLRLEGPGFAPMRENATYVGEKETRATEEGEDEYQDWRNGLKKEERWELLNRGSHNGKWTLDQSKKHTQDDCYFCEALTSQMGLSDHQKKLTWRIYKRMDMCTYRGLEPWVSDDTEKQYLVAFCVGAHVYNATLPDWADDWKYYPGNEYPPKLKRYNGPEARLEAEADEADAGDTHRCISRCADRLGFPEDDLRAAFEKVRCNLPNWLGDD